MRVLHLNTHPSGGSYEYAALLCTALVEQGIESRVLCKNSPSAQTGRVLLDRVIRRSYVSFSTEPWHGTRRLFRRSPVAGDAAAQNGRRDQYPRYVACDWRLLPLSWMRSVRQADTALRSMSDLEMACKPSSGKGCAFTEVAGISKLWSTHGSKQSLAGRNRRPKPDR